MPERLVLHAAADLVEPFVGYAHDVKRIGNLGRVRQHRVRDRAVRAGQVEGHPHDPGPPLVRPLREPGTRRSGVTTRYDVKQLPVTDQLGGPQPLPEAAGAHERGLVQSQRGDLPDPAGIVDKCGAVGDHGAVDGVPVTPEVVGDLGNRAAMSADLFAGPACGAIGDAAVADHDPLVGLHPRSHRARRVRAVPADLAPHRHHRSPERGQIDQPTPHRLLDPRGRPATRARRPREGGRDVDLHRHRPGDHADDVDVGESDQGTTDGRRLDVHRDPQGGWLRHPHSRGVPVLVRAPSTDGHPATPPRQLPKRPFLTSTFTLASPKWPAVIVARPGISNECPPFVSRSLTDFFPAQSHKAVALTYDLASRMRNHAPRL